MRTQCVRDATLRLTGSCSIDQFIFPNKHLVLARQDLLPSNRPLGSQSLAGTAGPHSLTAEIFLVYNSRSRDLTETLLFAIVD